MVEERDDAMDGQPAWTTEAEAFAPFRPRRGRIVAIGIAVTSLVLFGVLAILLPTQAGGAIWGPADQVMFFGIGVVIALLCHRYASIRAVPSRDGIVVRNLVFTRTLTWPQIVGVQFGGGQPWVQLDLDDLDSLAVMAIQKSDGAFALREASRLASLVMTLGEAAGPASPSEPEPDPSSDDPA